MAIIATYLKSSIPYFLNRYNYVSHFNTWLAKVAHIYLEIAAHRAENKAANQRECSQYPNMRASTEIYCGKRCAPSAGILYNVYTHLSVVSLSQTKRSREIVRVKTLFSVWYC